jgi:hypothetical protein
MNPVTGGKVRGTIIKVPDSSPGLLFVSGEQREFTLERVWRSPVAPATNMAVEVEFDSSGSIVALTAVDPKDLSKEKMDEYSRKAQEQGKQIFAIILQAVGTLADRMGKIPFGATVVLWIAWFILTAVSWTVFVGAKTFTFWELLGVDLSNPLNLGASSHGLFGMIGLLAIAAPVAAPFVRHPQANYLNALPLAYLVIAFLKIRSDLKEAMEVLRFGPGIYLLFLAGLVLAWHAYQSRSRA